MDGQLLARLFSDFQSKLAILFRVDLRHVGFAVPKDDLSSLKSIVPTNQSRRKVPELVR